MSSSEILRATPLSAAAEERSRRQIHRAFVDHYRCPEGFGTFSLKGELSQKSGYFRFGPDVICYGRCSSGSVVEHVHGALYDALADCIPDDGSVQLPFLPDEVVTNLRNERYLWQSNSTVSGISSALREAYYLVRPLLSVSVRKHLHRLRLRGWNQMPFPEWPVAPLVERIYEKLLALALKAQGGDQMPFIWFWPKEFASCAVMTHDVETLRGRDFCSELMDLDDAYGIKASFQIVPEHQYAVPDSFLAGIQERGFEVNVHDLNHDGRLFRDRETFLARVELINHYGKAYAASGFRSAALYRNLDWYDDLDFSYDMSVPCVGHLEAQRGGCGSVMPFFIGKILELPLTTTQDYSLFHILNDYSIDLWKKQIAAIAEKHGLITFIIHPDYILEPRARDTYKKLLGHLAQLRSAGNMWISSPGEVNRWWRNRAQMRLVRTGMGWQIEGPSKEQARVAYATLERDNVIYRFAT